MDLSKIFVALELDTQCAFLSCLFSTGSLPGVVGAQTSRWTRYRYDIAEYMRVAIVLNRTVASLPGGCSGMGILSSFYMLTSSVTEELKRQMLVQRTGSQLFRSGIAGSPDA